MGGGTGTGAAPVIAHAAKEQGILTVAVVTKRSLRGAAPHADRGKGHRGAGRHVDSLITIPIRNWPRCSAARRCC